MNAREEVLARLRSALGDGPAEVAVPRAYRRTGTCDPDRLAELLADRLVDYRAGVHWSSQDGLAETLSALLPAEGPLVVPPDVPDRWLAAYDGQVLVDSDDAPLGTGTLDGAASVLTGCATAIAQTGTLVLDGGTAQGRRLLTLIPDHHVCVVPVTDIVDTVPEGLQRLAPTRPLTLISGPSATSDIELSRVEGVHGPRRLDVVLVR
ncbi:lactate utilization protein C [Streptomyces durbertensis]|uniref:Lactate utilization protein C n=1 Tax=Streptomyces durbertensis TaxID=2448886 RepID=A0ABR6EA89_9ACTN|nr:LUD domain-containing protein [Streptomyces durbertensis]MBB1242259.1 lactate utilization protein C [Streptomyces durbertensis]